jgi:hypothetical protein
MRNSKMPAFMLVRAISLLMFAGLFLSRYSQRSSYSVTNTPQRGIENTKTRVLAGLDDLRLLRP